MGLLCMPLDCFFLIGDTSAEKNLDSVPLFFMALGLVCDVSTLDEVGELTRVCTGGVAGTDGDFLLDLFIGFGFWLFGLTLCLLTEVLLFVSSVEPSLSVELDGTD